MTRNHNLNQLCLLTTKNHPVFGTSRSRSQFSTKTRLITANQTTQFVFATLTSRIEEILLLALTQLTPNKSETNCMIKMFHADVKGTSSRFSANCLLIKMLFFLPGHAVSPMKAI